MTIIDSQVHVYEANTPKRPWHNVPNWPCTLEKPWLSSQKPRKPLHLKLSRCI
jgi:hypothetical protein